MIAVRIPKEIKAYKEKLVAGLTLRQLIASILAMAICVPLYIHGTKFLNEELVSWVVMFIALPLAGFGFFKFNGMPFEKFAVAIFRQAVLLPTKRKYKTENCFREWQDKAIAEENSKKGFNKFKIKREGIFPVL